MNDPADRAARRRRRYTVVLHHGLAHAPGRWSRGSGPRRSWCGRAMPAAIVDQRAVAEASVKQLRSCGSISTSAMWQPFGNVSGVSALTLVSRSSGISPLLFHLLGPVGERRTASDAAIGSNDAEMSGVFDIRCRLHAVSSAVAAIVLPFASRASTRLDQGVAHGHCRARADRGIACDLHGRSRPGAWLDQSRARCPAAPPAMAMGTRWRGPARSIAR